MNRVEAIERGSHVYVGRIHRRCGLRLRYTNCDACVTCARRRELAKRRTLEHEAAADPESC